MFSKVLAFALISVLTATPISYFDAGNANALIDHTLNEIKTNYKSTLDPLHIPDEVVSFSKKIVLFTIHGKAKLTEGTITGLSHLYRSGDSTFSNENNKSVFHLRFGNKNIHVHYKGDLSFMDINTKVTLEGQVGDIEAKAVVELDADGKPNITQFEIDELNQVNIQVKTPVAILDNIIGLFTKGFIKMFNPMVRELLSKTMRDMFRKELDNFKMPVGK